LLECHAIALRGDRRTMIGAQPSNKPELNPEADRSLTR
jgi:hypothetical protein